MEFNGSRKPDRYPATGTRVHVPQGLLRAYEASGKFEAWLLDEKKVITAIVAVDASAPASVTYYNLAGRASLSPFEGVNIVVTRQGGRSRVGKVIIR